MATKKTTTKKTEEVKVVEEVTEVKKPVEVEEEKPVEEVKVQPVAPAPKKVVKEAVDYIHGQYLFR